MLVFNEAALEEAAEQFLLSIPRFLAVPRAKQDIPADWSKLEREEFDAFWAAQRQLPRKSREPRQIPLKPAEQLQPITKQRALETLSAMLTGVYQQTQVQQLCFDVGRKAYPEYAPGDTVSEYDIVGVGGCLFRVLDEFCTDGGWTKRKTVREAQADIAGHTKTWISAPKEYYARLIQGSEKTRRGFLKSSEIEPWSVENIFNNQFINARSPERQWVLTHMTGGRSLELALTAANANQQAQYLFNHELHHEWFYGETEMKEISPQARRTHYENRERLSGIEGPVSFRYVVDSRLRLYATDTLSPQGGKTRTHFWTPCDVDGNKLDTETLDNTGSGFQITSCIALDEASALYSNLLPNEGEAYDIYVRISQEALKILSSEHPVSKLSLQERDNRTLKKISKTASMAMLYGGGITHYSKELIDFLGEELPTLTTRERREVEEAFDKALTKLFPHLRAAYQWMIEVLTVAAKHCDPLTITLGFDHKFRTKKRKQIRKKVEVRNLGGFIGQLGGIVRYYGDELDAKATARSYMAGIIQGADACVLGLTVSEYVRAGKQQGYDTFIATTHDSYRIVAGNSELLSECNRKSFSLLFKEVDVMDRLYKELKQQLADIQIPEPPQRGSLDIADVARATHILTFEPMEPPDVTTSDFYESIGF